MIARCQSCHQSLDQIGAFFVGTLADQEFIQEECKGRSVFLDKIRHPGFKNMLSDKGSTRSIRFDKFRQESKYKIFLNTAFFKRAWQTLKVQPHPWPPEVSIKVLHVPVPQRAAKL